MGGLSSGKAADFFGRKGALMLNTIIAFIAAILMTISKYVDVYILFIIGRFVVGIACGMYLQIEKIMRNSTDFRVL